MAQEGVRLKMKKILLMLSLGAISLVAGATAQDGEAATAIHDKAAAKMLVGKHKLSLQWISWDYFGSAFVINNRCRSTSGICYWLKGQQKGRGTTDHLKVDGMITSIDSKQFAFRGTIESKISHIYEGKPCVRSGDFTFKITGKRKYWRLAEMDNPCDEAADYVDIYFR
jgi:hypothetical protein